MKFRTVWRGTHTDILNKQTNPKSLRVINVTTGKQSSHRHCTSDVDFIREVQNNMIYHIYRYCTNSSTSTLNSDLFCKPIFVKFGEKVSSMQVTILMLTLGVYRPNCENQQSGLDTITFPFLHFHYTHAKNKVCDVSLRTFRHGFKSC